MGEPPWERPDLRALPALSAAADFELELPGVHAAFGQGRSRALGADLQRLGIARALVVATPAGESRYAGLTAALGEACAAAFFGAEPHCPEPVVERCRAAYLAARCDGVVAIGGGSTLGLGKILAAEHVAKFVALPTTYSGSEMTPLFGRKIGAEKRVAKDSRCRPVFVIYDPALTATLPARIAATSGLNSIAHAVEALYPKRPNPLAHVLAEQALGAQRDGLRAIAAGQPGAEALAAAQYGAFLGGLLVAMCGIALHHRLCHVIGGLFDLPHAETNAVVLPHAVAYILAAIPAARAVIERVFGADHAARGLAAFAREIGAPRSLRELGMPEQGIGTVVSALLELGGWNPRPLEQSGIAALVRDAFEGRDPA